MRKAKSSILSVISTNGRNLQRPGMAIDLQDPSCRWDDMTSGIGKAEGFRNQEITVWGEPLIIKTFRNSGRKNVV